MRYLILLLIVLTGCEPHPTCTCEVYRDGELISTRDYRRDGGCFDSYESYTRNEDGEVVRYETICESK